jgi:hypothetical protein
MEVIILKGAPSSGKTTSLGLLYALLVHAPGNPPTAILSPAVQVGGRIKDFEVLLEYTGKAGRKKIAIYTLGDYVSCVKAAAAAWGGKNADILVVAFNDKFAASAAKLVAPHGISHTLCKKKVSGPAKTKSFYIDCLKANMKTAMDIQALL